MSKEYYAYIKGFFDRLAPFYGFFDLLLAGTRVKVAALAGAPMGSKVLDVCTGTGQQAFAFARMGYAVVGIDLSESMLKIALRRNKFAGPRFNACDAARMPFGDGVFDVSCVSFGLHEMPGDIRQKVLGEMARVTKRGGMILIVDYSLDMDKTSGKLAYHVIRTFESKYFPEFVRSDFRKAIKLSEINITSEYPLLRGSARLFKGSCR